MIQCDQNYQVSVLKLLFHFMLTVSVGCVHVQMPPHQKVFYQLALGHKCDLPPQITI